MSALRDARCAEIVASDEDPATVDHLRSALERHYLGGDSWPEEWNFTGTIRVQQGKFSADCLNTELLRPGLGVNALLLDPTYPPDYSKLVKRTLSVARTTGASVLLLCWQVTAWGIDRDLRDAGLVVEKATLDRYSVVAVSLGADAAALSSVAAESVRGWHG
jgi:hypothetical protein